MSSKKAALASLRLAELREKLRYHMINEDEFEREEICLRLAGAGDVDLGRLVQVDGSSLPRVAKPKPKPSRLEGLESCPRVAGHIYVLQPIGEDAKEIIAGWDGSAWITAPKKYPADKGGAGYDDSDIVGWTPGLSLGKDFGAPVIAKSAPSPEDKIKFLSELYERGELSEEDFRDAARRLLRCA